MFAAVSDATEQAAARDIISVGTTRTPAGVDTVFWSNAAAFYDVGTSTNQEPTAAGSRRDSHVPTASKAAAIPSPARMRATHGSPSAVPTTPASG